MTKQETAKMMAVLKTAYPRYYAGKSESEQREAWNLWHMMLGEYEYGVVAAAVKALIATLKYPPTIADVTEKIRMLTVPEGMDESEAWNYVRKAVRNSLYNAGEEFDKLPEECRAVVCAPEQLRAWAMLDEDEFNTVVASNFKRSYRNTSAKRREYDMLPPEVKGMLDEISVKMIGAGA